jgi:hypothetical protein
LEGQAVRLAATALLIFNVCQISAAIDQAGEPLPSWIMPGIAMRETSSYYLDGYLIYVDRRIGAAGELGPWQMKPGTLAMVFPKWKADTLRTNVFRAELATVSYLRWLRQRTGSWAEAVGCYKTGLYGDRAVGRLYYLDIAKKGGLL